MLNYQRVEENNIPIGSMVLLYMVLHGSHQYIPFMLAYIPYMDPMG